MLLTGRIRNGAPQRGQMLVGVMVLLAIIFMLGSAMALGVSSSLHQIDQGATQDAARYAAESAVARGQAAIQSAPTLDGCGPVSNLGSLNGQAMQAQPCYIRAVDADSGNVRYSSQAETVLGSGECLSVPLNGGTAPRAGIPDIRQGRVWTTVAWRSTTGTTADLTVFVDDEAGCELTDEDRIIGCAASSNSAPVYMSCAFPMDPLKPDYFLDVVNSPKGGSAIVSDFVVRDAAAGHSCVATVIGASQAASDEGDLILPGTPLVNPTGCGTTGARLGLRNRLKP